MLVGIRDTVIITYEQACILSRQFSNIIKGLTHLGNMRNLLTSSIFEWRSCNRFNNAISLPLETIGCIIKKVEGKKYGVQA